MSTMDAPTGPGGPDDGDATRRYLEQIRSDIAMAKPLRVVVDCGNGAAGVIAPRAATQIRIRRLQTWPPFSFYGTRRWPLQSALTLRPVPILALDDVPDIPQ